MNNVNIVGRLVSNPELVETENDKKVTYITLAVPRYFKNEEGIYETDFIKCILWGNMSDRVVEYCRKGDVLGIRGRLQTHTIEHDDFKYEKLEVVAERVHFLKASKGDD